MKTWILHDSKFGNGKFLAENIAKIMRENGTVQIGHVNDVDPKTVAEDIPDLLILGGAVRIFQTSRAQKKWFSRLTNELKKTDKIIPYGAVFLTHARNRKSLEGYGERYRKFVERSKEIGRVYNNWCSAQVKGQEGPFIEGEIDKGIEFARNLLSWINSL